MNPSDLTISQAAELLGSRKLGAVELFEACLARIEEREAEIGAWEHLAAEQALERARALDDRRPEGPLHGIPVGVKDIFETHDMPTCYGSPIYAGNRPPADAAIVAMLRRQGAVVLGKTVTTEFAYFRPGKTRNPVNPAHTPGGSSSGSAAAVAAGMVPLALGSQTAASLIRPAAYCGLVGFKSAQGSLPLAGVKALSQSLDSAGWLTRSVADAALVFAALTGAAPDEAPPAPRIGLCRTPEWEHAQPAAVAALERAAEALQAGGGTVQEVTLPPLFDSMVATHKTVMAYEAVRCLQDEYARHRDALSPQLLALLDEGAEVSFDVYRNRQAQAREGRAHLAGLLQGYDVLLAPSATGEAPDGIEATGDPIFSRMWTLMKLPAIHLPVGRGPQGLPVGAQLLGPLTGERRLLALAAWAEAQVYDTSPST